MARDSYGTLDALKVAVSTVDVKDRFVSKLKEADADKDGSVTEAEFCAALPSLDIGITSDEARAVFGLLDVYEDGVLKIDELLLALNADVAGAPAAKDLLALQPDVNLDDGSAGADSDKPPVERTPSQTERSMKLVQEALTSKGAGLIAALREMGK